MSNKQKEKDQLLAWQLRSLGMANDMASIGLGALWGYAQNKLTIDQVNFGNLFRNFGEVLHMVQILELQPMAREEDKKKLGAEIDAAMRNKATHDVLYEAERKGKHLKDQMVAWLKEAIVEHLDYFENLEARIGKTLNEPYDVSGGEDHPLEDLLDRRDRIGWIVIGLYLLHAEDQYISVDVEYLEARLKRYDLILRKKVLECVTFHYKDYHEPKPYSPKDFWWRAIPGHEYELKEYVPADFWWRKIPDHE